MNANESKGVLAVLDAAIDQLNALGGDFVKPSDDAEHSDLIERARQARLNVEIMRDALKMAERIIAAWLEASGYKPGACTDEWVPEIRNAVASLVPIRSALARVGGGA